MPPIRRPGEQISPPVSKETTEHLALGTTPEIPAHGQPKPATSGQPSPAKAASPSLIPEKLSVFIEEIVSAREDGMKQITDLGVSFRDSSEFYFLLFDEASALGKVHEKLQKGAQPDQALDQLKDFYNSFKKEGEKNPGFRKKLEDSLVPVAKLLLQKVKNEARVYKLIHDTLPPSDKDKAIIILGSTKVDINKAIERAKAELNATQKTT